MLDNYKRVIDIEHFAVTEKNKDLWIGAPINYTDDIQESMMEIFLERD